MTDHKSRTADLAKEYLALRNRYGEVEPRPEVAGIELAMNRRRFRIQHLHSQLAEIQEQLRWLESELEGYDKGMELVLLDAIEQLRRGHEEAWSPFPVLGYRMWLVDEHGFCGVKRVWASSTMNARCLTTGEDDEVPHTDGRCGNPACGIYATKSVRHLLGERLPRTDDTIAVGLVGMSGKVVEHRRGYRAQRTTVLALVLLGEVSVGIDDPAEIESLFANSLHRHSSRGDPIKGDPIERTVEYLEERARRLTWTLDKKSE